MIARAKEGTDEILYADIDFTRNTESNARRLFLRDRRPELYGAWIKFPNSVRRPLYDLVEAPQQRLAIRVGLADRRAS